MSYKVEYNAETGEPRFYYRAPGAQSWQRTVKPSEDKVKTAQGYRPNYHHHRASDWETFGARMAAAYGHQDHIHFAMSPGKLFHAPLGTDPNGYSMSMDFDVTPDEARVLLGLPKREESKMFATNPDDLEAAAYKALAEAEAVRKFDTTEPQGDEPTISFTHTYGDQPGGSGTNRDYKAYTYVGFKATGEGGTDRWYITGVRGDRIGYSWRELGAKFPAIATGEFLTVAKWV